METPQLKVRIKITWDLERGLLSSDLKSAEICIAGNGQGGLLECYPIGKNVDR